MRPDAVPEQDSPHGLGNRLGRVLWGVVYSVFFRTSPRFLHGYRNRLLRAFGARLHPSARVYPGARIWAPWNLRMREHACIGDDVDVYCVAPVTIGSRSTVSQYCYLCSATHDFERPHHPLVTAAITLGDNVWLAADVFVGPGVTVGDGTVVGARSSVFGDLPRWVVAVGSPARAVRERRLED